MEDKVVYRIISNIAVLENNDRVENKLCLRKI